MSHFDLQFEKMFVISTTALRINRAHYSIARNLKWIKQCFLFFLSTFTLSAFLLNAILFHDIRSGNVAEASKNLSMVLVAITITLKYIVLLYHQNSMNHIVATVNKDYDLAKDFPEEEKQIVLIYAKKGVTVSKFWLVFGFGTSAVFPAKAFALMAYYYWKGEFVLVPLFDFRYPDQIEVYKNETWMFLMQFGLCFVFGSYAATMYVGFDPLVPIFMLHTCGQLELLCGRISKTFVDDVNNTKENLKVIVLKLQVLYDIVSRVNFYIFYEYSMKGTSFIIPLSAFLILEDFRNSRFNIEFFLFFISCLLHFYTPCYYSDLLMDTCETFRQSIYSCGWEKHPDKQARQIVLFMLTRTRAPMGITTVFFSINLDTFAEMCRQSYGILNLLNASV